MHGGGGVRGDILVLSAVVTSLEVQGTLVIGSALHGCVCPNQASLHGCAVLARCAGGLGSPQPLLQPWHREPTWGGAITFCLLSWTSAEWWHGPISLSVEDVPGRAWLWPLLARLCVCPELLHQSRVAACKEETGESHTACHDDSPSASRANSRCWI